MNRLGSIMFYTAGMLLQQFLHNSTLEGVSHIIIDEVHERSAITDLMLILLRRLVNTTNLKVILMSASTNTEQLQYYFGLDKTALVKVRGTLYPLKRHYLADVLQTLSLNPEQYNLNSVSERMVNTDMIVAVIHAIDNSRPAGAILCFLPGWQDIKIVLNKLLEDNDAENGLWVLPLHSRLSNHDQVMLPKILYKKKYRK